MTRTLRRRTTASVDLQTLEARRLLVAFGTPWPDARELSISFPADGVDVGQFRNNLGGTLDAVAARDQWQELALRAYQTWAIHADINVGLRNDFDVSFGTPGMSVGDPRFGEFRIGAFPQQGLLANSLPFQAVAGTYSGDLLVNSNEQFSYHDWADDQGPDLASLDVLDRDLFSLFLHESGNTLGLDDNQMDWTVMFRQYTVPKGVLSAEDIESIQSLYGARSDPYESVDNGELQVASIIPSFAGLDPTHDVIRTRGSIAKATDVDVYQVVPEPGYDNATIRVRAAGVSLLMSRLEVVDEAGNVLQSASAQSVFDNDNLLQISDLQRHNAIYLRISAVDSGDVYSVGDYQLEIDYREPDVQAADPIAGTFDSGADALFANFSLVDDEVDANNNRVDALELAAADARAGDRFEQQSSLASAADVDVWKVTAPDHTQGRLMVTVAGVGVAAPDLAIYVVDSNGKGVVSSGRLSNDGTWTMEVGNPQPGADYFIRISVDPTSDVGIGNYVATAEFESPSDQMNLLAEGEISDSVDEFVRWTAGKTKLFRFDLSAHGGSSDQGVRLTIYDAHTRETEMVLVAHSGLTRNAFAWLQQGDYILRFTSFSLTDQPVAAISYSLTCDGLSDDQDEDDYDPSDDPDYLAYEYDPVEPVYEYQYYNIEVYYDFEAYYDGYYQSYYEDSC
ncbi:MAG: matrixin family metalloprotease [Pirellulaceae bacterium]|nr:matrixin family metalloprotease [Pirellulaceae bacterium]